MKSLCQPTIRRRVHLEIAIVHPILMTVHESMPIKPQRYHEVLKVQSTGEIVLLIAHPYQQLDQSALVIHFFTTAYDQRVCLLAKATTDKRTATATKILASSPPSDSGITTLDETVPPLQLIPISMHPAKAFNVEPFWMYRSKYSNTRNGGGVMTGPSRGRQ